MGRSREEILAELNGGGAPAPRSREQILAELNAGMPEAQPELTQEQKDYFAHLQQNSRRADKDRQMGAIYKQVEQNATLGMGDEIRGAVGGAVSAATGGSFKDGYKESRDADRNLQDQQAKEFPVSTTLSGILAPTPIPAAKGGKLARLAKTVGEAAALGAGKSRAEDAAGVAKDAGVSAAVGAAGFALGSAAGKRLEKASRPVEQAAEAAADAGKKGSALGAVARFAVGNMAGGPVGGAFVAAAPTVAKGAGKAISALSRKIREKTGVKAADVEAAIASGVPKAVVRAMLSRAGVEPE